MSKESVSVVCDARPLIHLSELGCLSLLNDFAAVLVPEQVWQEVAQHQANALDESTLDFQTVPVNISSTNAPDFDQSDHDAASVCLLPATILFGWFVLLAQMTNSCPAVHSSQGDKLFQNSCFFLTVCLETPRLQTLH